MPVAAQQLSSKYTGDFGIIFYLCAVKSSIRLLIIVSLLAVYCFAIGRFNPTHNFYDTSREQNSAAENYYSEFSTKYFCHTSQTEYSLSDSNKLPDLRFKNPFAGVVTDNKVSAQLVVAYFKQYTNASRNFLVQHRKTDVIFPFHYFW